MQMYSEKSCLKKCKYGDFPSEFVIVGVKVKLIMREALKSASSEDISSQDSQQTSVFNVLTGWKVKYLVLKNIKTYISFLEMAFRLLFSPSLFK